MKNWKGVFFKYLANVKKGASNHSLYQNVFQGCNLLGKKFFKVPVQIMSLTLSKTSPGFYASLLKTLREKEKLPIWRTFYHLNHILNCRLQTLSVWKRLKSVVWERFKGLPPKQTLYRVK